ncbi:MAG: hypothetical protein JWP65_854, partial [Ramlibacter sp.]|uniref:hypothetical protein n=1 Tax=Ramlibacter sp. TaxID=1917967 RepID=UPI00260767E3
FAIEAARAGTLPPAQVRDLFTLSLAALVRRALAPEGGDPVFQALVLHAGSEPVREHVRLATRAAADRRTLRAAIDAVAHPGKLRDMPAAALRDALARLHALLESGAWAQLHAATQATLVHASGDARLHAALASLLAEPALERLQRGDALRPVADVQRYLALAQQRGPPAGSELAAAQGRASARLGSDAEAATLQALRTIAGLLEEGRPAGRYRAVAGLRTPAGFPGAADKAKDEWDGAIVRTDAGADAADVLLLAEVKAAPAAATPDFARLVRGLERLAQAGAETTYLFPTAGGELRIRGASLRRLLPHRDALPAHVVYCCAAMEAQPQPLGAATRAVLLAEPATVAFARQLAGGEPAPHDALAPVWQDLTTAPRLRSALNQYRTAVAARDAMLHPDDLLAAVRERLAPGAG